MITYEWHIDAVKYIFITRRFFVLLLALALNEVSHERIKWFVASAWKDLKIKLGLNFRSEKIWGPKKILGPKTMLVKIIWGS